MQENKQKTIVLVLRTGKDFGLRDVDLIAFHIRKKWLGTIKPRIICICDKVTQPYDLGHIELIPMTNNWPGTWSRMQLYSPEMEQYKPFLYVDLDTAVLRSLENIFLLVKNENLFITLDDFWQRGLLATGLVWFPLNSSKTKKVFDTFKSPTGNRMDYFLRQHITADEYWQNLTDSIADFKPKDRKQGLLQEIKDNVNLVCFHGKPRIWNAEVDWVKNYIKEMS